MASTKVVRKIISSAQAPKPIGPYNQAVVVNQVVYLSGIVGLDKNTGKLVGPDVASETKQVLVNIQNILNEAGSNLDKVAKVTIYLTNLDDFGVVNDVYKQYITNNYPARTTVQVSKLPLGARILIDAIGVVGEVETVQV